MASLKKNSACVAAIATFCLLACAGGIGSKAAETLIIQLKNGDRISGQLVAETTNSVSITHAILGQITVPRGEIAGREFVKPAAAAINGEKGPPEAPGPFNVPSAPTTVPAPETRTNVVKAVPAPEAPKPKRELNWKSEVQMGMNLRYSSKDQQEFLVLAKTTYAERPFRHIFDYNFNYGRTEGLISGNRMTGSAKTEYDLSERVYLFGLAGGGYDEIRKIDLQYELSPGVGVTLVNSTNYNFIWKSEVGFTYQQQFRADRTEQETYSARLAELFTWRVWKTMTADAKIEVFPNMAEFGEYRLRLEGTLRYPLSNRLSLNLVVIDLYDTLPPAGVEPNDLQIRSTLGIRF